MNLLLLLSALFGALTGQTIGSSVPPPVTATRLAAVAATASEQAAARTVGVAALIIRDADARLMPLALLRQSFASLPAYTGRRRE